MESKNVLKLDLVLIVGSLILLIFLVGYVSPMVIAPIDDYETMESEILFSIDKAERLLIDDNVEFTSPEEFAVSDGLKITLEPGEYYWKAVGVVKSEVRTLTIKSVVDLRLKEMENSYGVVNAGNVRLNVDVYNGSELVDKVSLEIGDGEELNVEGTKLIGGMA
ncbi:hypothetical protein HOA55_01595 [archaeon]|jgi:hypothetical protein|nr:hypothetical protein [archaeon]MBT6820028.1 hypothetical protein [archaeon]MBT7238445.1 hypothetical protein [archaeon]